MRRRASIGLVLMVACVSGTAGAQQLTAGFDDMSLLAGDGWVIANNSDPAGSTSWFQGNTAVFASQSGAVNSYAAANFNAAAFGGDISLWMLTPTLTNLRNGELLTFYTRTETGAPLPDRLEVRVSVSGVSTDIGATDTSVGDFTILLLTVNPLLATAGYPEAWTLYTVTLSGLPPGASSGRIGFRYFVTDTSTNADYIGLDTLSLTGTVDADLAITKTVDIPAPFSGSTVTFTLTVTNAGPATATNVIVTDLLPAGLEFQSATASQGSYVDGTGIWNVGTVNTVTPQTLQIVARSLQSPATNTATVATADQLDPSSENDTSRVTLTAAAIPIFGTAGVTFLIVLIGLVGALVARRSE